MIDFEIEVGIEVPLERVFEGFWDPKRWPEVADHVKKIDTHFEDDLTQVLTMRVETRGRMDSFRTVRIRHDDSIFYYQPQPPVMLREHYGWWQFTRTSEGTIVTSRHVVSVNHETAGDVLKSMGITANGPSEAEDAIRDIIEGNSATTMQAVKNALERNGA